MDFHVLLDAPTGPASRLQIAKLGSFKDSRYGKFQITRQEVEDWQRNLDLLPGKRALIDLDHAADRAPRNTEAAGWITGVELDGDTPMATVEWTPVGKQAIEEKRYLFFSPTYGKHKTEDGTVHANTLIGGALTNRPFLNMPAVTLASAETLQRALDQDESRRLLHEALQRIVPPASADSRPAMNPELLKTLGLAEDADETTTLEAVKALAAKANEPTEPTEAKTLEQQAQEAGKVLLDGAEVAQLKLDAAAGANAARELAASRFETSFDRAVREGRAIPDQREQFTELHAEKPELALKMLDNGPKIVNTTPSGWNNDHLQLQDAPLGVEPEAHQLDQAVKARLRELGKGMDEYITVLEQMQQEAF